MCCESVISGESFEDWSAAVGSDSAVGVVTECTGDWSYSGTDSEGFGLI